MTWYSNLQTPASASSVNPVDQPFGRLTWPPDASTQHGADQFHQNVCLFAEILSSGHYATQSLLEMSGEHHIKPCLAG